MARLFFLPLLAFLFAASISVLSAQTELIEQKAKSGEAFSEKALKPGQAKPEDKTVGGNYNYGKKAPPADMKAAPKSSPQILPPAPKPQKPDQEKGLTTGEVAVGVGALLFFPFLFLAPALVKEAAEKQSTTK